MERLKLPANVRAHANPKSSTGRVDIFTRVIADHSPRFDQIASGYQGKLWLEVFTRSFLVKVRMGMALSQLRLIVDQDLDKERRRGGSTRLAIPPSAPEVLRIHLGSSDEEPDPSPVGFKAKRNNSTLLSLDRRNHVARDFWEPIWPDGQLVLEPEEFYLLRSQELVAIPAELAAEMVPFEPTSGELRTHYAGFFDPGFGADESGFGLPAVLEVRAHDVPFMMEDGQEVARLRYERLAEAPERVYGRAAGSNYAGAQQWRFLSKHFGPWAQLPLRF